MQPAGILGKRILPSNRHSKKKGIEAGIIETFAEVATQRDRLALAPILVCSTALDDSHELARMVFDSADIRDGDVSCSRSSIIDSATKSVINLPVTTPRPRSEAFGENQRWRRDRNYHDMCIGAAHRLHHRA
jgi:hypothetical protein